MTDDEFDAIEWLLKVRKSGGGVKGIETANKYIESAEYAAKKMAYARSLLSWGGATVSRDDWQAVPDGIDAWAVSLKLPGQDSIQVPEDPSWQEFSDAWDKAVANYDSPYLGVFHDDGQHSVQFDPVAVVGTTEEVDALYDQGYPVDGGAYGFLEGNGYWPGKR